MLPSGLARTRASRVNTSTSSGASMAWLRLPTLTSTHQAFNRLTRCGNQASGELRGNSPKPRRIDKAVVRLTLSNYHRSGG